MTKPSTQPSLLTATAGDDLVDHSLAKAARLDASLKAGPEQTRLYLTKTVRVERPPDNLITPSGLGGNQAARMSVPLKPAEQLGMDRTPKTPHESTS